MVLLVRAVIVVVFAALVAASAFELSPVAVAGAAATSLLLAVYLLLHAWDFRRVLVRLAPSSATAHAGGATAADLFVYVVLYPLYRVGIAFGFVVLALFYAERLQPGLIVQGADRATGLWDVTLFAVQHVVTQVSAGLIVPAWSALSFHDSGAGYYLGWFVAVGGFSTCVALIVTWIMLLTVRRPSREPLVGFVEPFREDSNMRPANYRRGHQVRLGVHPTGATE